MELWTCCPEAEDALKKYLKLMDRIVFVQSDKKCWCCGRDMIEVRFYAGEKTSSFEIKVLCSGQNPVLKEFVEGWIEHKKTPCKYSKKCGNGKYKDKPDAPCKGEGAKHPLWVIGEPEPVPFKSVPLPKKPKK